MQLGAVSKVCPGRTKNAALLRLVRAALSCLGGMEMSNIQRRRIFFSVLSLINIAFHASHMHVWHSAPGHTHKHVVGASMYGTVDEFVGRHSKCCEREGGGWGIVRRLFVA